jgi:hypothetical protein
MKCPPQTHILGTLFSAGEVFWKVVEILGDEALVEEVGHWGRGCLSLMGILFLAPSFLFLFPGCH